MVEKSQQQQPFVGAETQRDQRSISTKNLQGSGYTVGEVLRVQLQIILYIVKNWRWRESNPRPEARTKNLYRFSCCLLQRGKHNSSSLKLAVCRIKFPYLYAALQAGESRFVTSIPELGTAPRVPVTANYAASANSGLLAVIIVPLLGDWRSTCNPWSINTPVEAGTPPCFSDQ